MGQQPQNNDHNLIADRFQWPNVSIDSTTSNVDSHWPKRFQRSNYQSKSKTYQVSDSIHDRQINQVEKHNDEEGRLEDF